jgi:Fe-S-cluster-containing dehydrogenase component
MTRYGFVIDQDTCIGCHACTVACKAEHDVAIGVNRTWVKYIETGSFPDTRRQFSVLRCNHCDDAPCVAICPTTALFTRPDGIVDFEAANCIGCKSCMQACPYDALYIDPASQTAAKCNYCAHKVDVGIEPACVSVCPTQSILAGDLDDQTTRIAQVVATGRLQVRAPEQGTRPKLYYKGADQASLDPLGSRIPDDGMIWADLTGQHRGGRDEEARARAVYTTAHELPWKAKVSAYLVTKAIAGGALVVAALLVLLGAGDGAAVRIAAPLIALVFTAVTGALLVADLRRPERFWYLLSGRANWGSWLVKGAVVLFAYGAVAALWLLAGLLAADAVVAALAIPGALLGAAAAGYTAALFRQCEGRDLWQSPLVLPMLLAQAVAAGAAALLVVPGTPSRPLEWALAGGMAATVALMLLERGETANARAAVRILRADRRWMVALGWAVVSGGMAVLGAGPPAAVAALVAIALEEHAFVRAAQEVPLS